MQNSVQNSKSIRYGSGILKINGINIGALKNVEMGIDYTTLQLKSDNAKLPPRRVVTKAALSASILEISLDSLAMLDGVGTLVNTAASAVNITNEVIRATGTFFDNEILFFANKNGDNTVVTGVTVKNGATTLAEGTAYALVVENGRTGIVSLANLTLTGIGLNVTYTYTPNLKKTYTITDISKAITLYTSTFENVDEFGKKFTLTLPQSFNSADLKFGYNSDEELDKVIELPITLEAYPDSSRRMVIIDDEQAA